MWCDPIPSAASIRKVEGDDDDDDNDAPGGGRITEEVEDVGIEGERRGRRE